MEKESPTEGQDTGAGGDFLNQHAIDLELRKGGNKAFPGHVHQQIEVMERKSAPKMGCLMSTVGIIWWIVRRSPRLRLWDVILKVMLELLDAGIVDHLEWTCSEGDNCTSG